MIEELRAFLKRKFDYQLDQFAVFQTEYEPSKLVPIGLGAFAVVAVFYLLDLIFGWGIMTFVLFAILFVVLVLMPLAFRKTSKYDAIFVTPEYLIQSIGKNEFVAVNYDDIKDFKVTADGVIIKGKRHTIKLGLSLTREEVDSIIDILEAKGKTFDPEKEYMIRPVEIRIVNNEIKLVDIEVVNELDRVYEKYQEDYLMLTPGYLDQIIFTNTNVEDVCIDPEHNNFGLKVDAFEVKDGHPENTKFESIIAQDGILVFHKFVIEQLILQNTHDKNEADQELKHDPKELEKHLKNAVITQWRTQQDKLDIHFATGVHILKAQVAFKDVLVGWNKTKE